MVLMQAIWQPHLPPHKQGGFPNPVYPYFAKETVDGAATEAAIHGMRDRLEELRRGQENRKQHQHQDRGE